MHLSWSRRDGAYSHNADVTAQHVRPLNTLHNSILQDNTTYGHGGTGGNTDQLGKHKAVCRRLPPVDDSLELSMVVNSEHGLC
jgi:hypothetical protein